MFAEFTSLEKVTAPCTIKENADIDETEVTVDWHHEYEKQKTYTRKCSGSSKVLCTYYENTKLKAYLESWRVNQ